MATKPITVFFLLALTQLIAVFMYSIFFLCYFLNSLPRNPNNCPNIPKHLPNQLSFGISKVNIDKIPITPIAISIKLSLHVCNIYSIIIFLSKSVLRLYRHYHNLVQMVQIYLTNQYHHRLLVKPHLHHHFLCRLELIFVL
jgi:hypothetical protein